MFIITSRDYEDEGLGLFTVLDTDDMSEETLDTPALLVVLDNNYKIYGIAEKSTSYTRKVSQRRRYSAKDAAGRRVTDILVCVKLTTYDGEIYYDGYVCYDNISNLGRVDVINVKVENLSDAIYDELLNNLLFKCNSWNYDLFDFVICTNFQYEYVNSKGASEAVIRSLDNGETFEVSYFDIAALYLLSGIAIRGIEKIDADGIKFEDGSYLSKQASLLDLRRFSEVRNTINELDSDGNLTGGLDVITLDSIDDLLTGLDVPCVYDGDVPLYSLLGKFKQENFMLAGYMCDKSFEVVDVSGGVVTFADNVSYSIKDNAAYLVRGSKYFQFRSDEVKSSFNELCDMFKAKYLVVKKRDFESSTEYNNIDIYPLDATIRGGGECFRGVHNGLFVDSSGKFLEIHKSALDCYSSVWITRLTHTGSAVVHFDGEVVLGPMNAITPGALSNDAFSRAVYEAAQGGMLYHNNSILPLCLDYDMYVKEQFWVVCLIKDTRSGTSIRKEDKLDFGVTAFGIIRVPLICLGSTLRYNGEWFKLDLFCQQLVFNQKFLESLSYTLVNGASRVDYFDFNSGSTGISSANERKLIGTIKSSAKNSLKKLKEI